MKLDEAKRKYGSLERYLSMLISGLKFAEATDITGVSVWLLQRDINAVKAEIEREIVEDKKKYVEYLEYSTLHGNVTFAEYSLIARNGNVN